MVDSWGYLLVVFLVVEVIDFLFVKGNLGYVFGLVRV